MRMEDPELESNKLRIEMPAMEWLNQFDTAVKLD